MMLHDVAYNRHMCVANGSHRIFTKNFILSLLLNSIEKFSSDMCNHDQMWFKQRKHLSLKINSHFKTSISHFSVQAHFV